MKVLGALLLNLFALFGWTAAVLAVDEFASVLLGYPTAVVPTWYCAVVGALSLLATRGVWRPSDLARS